MRIVIHVALALLMPGLLLGGCATLPSSGPTGRQIRTSAALPDVPFRIVDIDQATVDAIGRVVPVVPTAAGFETDARVDTVGPGDILDINIYEVGITLFSGNGGAGGTAGTFDPSARVTKLGDVVVDGNGTILLPYIGRLSVAGATPAQIERGLRGKSQSPQALVSVKTNAFNTFYVSGDVRQPGRYTLALPRERLLDGLARAGGTANGTAGGTVNQPNDMVVRVTRGSNAFEARLSEVKSGGPLDVALSPGDRIELFNRPRTFLIFGATDKVAQVPFGASALTLAEALARSGGPSERIADPSAIFLFRQSAVAVSPAATLPAVTAMPSEASLVPPPYPGTNASAYEEIGLDTTRVTTTVTTETVSTVGAGVIDPVPAAKPIIYRLDMTRADAFFMSQSFELQDKDVIYIANARANAPTKLAQILGQLFSPFLAARAVVGR